MTADEVDVFWNVDLNCCILLRRLLNHFSYSAT